MTLDLSTAIFWAGVGQWSVLVASALVPVRLRWRETLAPLPRLVRQLFWVYGGYVVLSIVSLGLVCMVFSRELSEGSPLARAICGYIAVFWLVRLALQLWLDARPYLTAWWLHGGEYVLTVLFTTFVLVLGWAAIH
jgi:hypothetical protein